MMGRQHAVSGVLAVSTYAYFQNIPAAELVLGITLLPGFCLISDIDHADATSSNTFGPITRIPAFFLGHRRETHCIPGILVCMFATWLAVREPQNLASEIWLTIILLLGWASTIRLFKLGGKGRIDDFFPIPFVVGIVWFPNQLATAGIHFPLHVLPVALGAGMAIHVIGDMLTLQGCPLLWPFSDDRTALGLFKAGGITERYLVLPLMLGGTVVELFLWAKYGMSPGLATESRP